MSLAKLTSISTSTLSLLLERQRLQTLPQYTNQTSNPLHIPQITRNLAQLKRGVLELEVKEGRSEAVTLLRSQYERMRGMLGDEADKAGIERLVDEQAEQEDERRLGKETEESPASSSRTPSPSAQPYKTHTRSSSTEPIYTPYADDPEAGPDPAIMLQEQRRLMTGTWKSNA
jgi:syntaxin 8